MRLFCILLYDKVDNIMYAHTHYRSENTILTHIKYHVGRYALRVL